MSEVITDNLDLWTSALHTKSSAGRGKNGKQEAYGIKKLRELILELAVRGKLVPQDPSDEPAADLLKKIAEQKSGLIEQRKIKRQKSLPKVARDEPIFTVPHAWRWTRLGEITSYGITDKAESSDVEKETWVLELEDVEKETSKLLRKRRFSERPFLSSKNRFISGDVIYGKLRPYLDKVLVADENGVCTTEMVPIRGYANLNPFYIRLVMKSPQFIKYADDSTHGMNLPRLATDKARLALFPLPPLAEQNRIVDKVDELMALCDQLEQQQTNSLEAHQTLVETLLGTLTSAASQQEAAEAWARIADHFDTLFTTEHSIDQLKQTILQLAVMGKLVPQDPNEEPASVLLDSIASERDRFIREGKGRNQKALPPINAEERPFDLPVGWEWVRFSDYALEISTGPFGSMIHREDYVAEGVPLINPSHMVEDKIVPDVNVAISEGKAKEFESYALADGDIVMARRGEVGRIALVTKKEAGWLCGTGSFVLRFNKGVVRPYLKLIFRCEFVRAYLAGAAVGATMVNLNHGILKKMPLAVPPVAEQHRIVAKVEELTTLCDAVKARLANARTIQLHLAEAIVEHAVA